MSHGKPRLIFILETDIVALIALPASRINSSQQLSVNVRTFLEMVQLNCFQVNSTESSNQDPNVVDDETVVMVKITCCFFILFFY